MLVEIERLRGVAILMVLLCHFFAFHVDAALNPLVFGFLTRQWPGVELFFVLSGFVITRSVQGRFAAKKGLGATAREMLAYITRRAFRVLPPPLFWFAVVGVYVACFKPDRLGDLGGSLYAFLTLSHNSALVLRQQTISWFGPFWSLSIEEQFYLVFLLIFTVVRSRAARILVTALIIVSIGVFIRALGWTVYGHFEPDAPIWFLTRLRIDALFVGSLLALLLHDHAPKPAVGWRRSLLMAVGLLALAVELGATSVLAGSRAEQFYTNIFYVSGGVLLYLAQRDEGLVGGRGWLASWLAQLGRISFSLYVSHLFLFEALLLLGGTKTISTMSELVVLGPACLIATCLISQMSYQYVEEPCRRFGKQLAERLLQNRADSEAQRLPETSV